MHRPRNDGNKCAPVHNQALQQRAMPAPDALETPFKALLKAREQPFGAGGVLLGSQQIYGQCRHKSPAQQITGKHGEDHRLRKRHKEIARHSAEEEHGQKHDADAERRDQGRHGDLRRALENGLAQSVALFKEALDVFNRDGGVIDQNPHGQRQTAERHGVDGLADQAENDDGREDG